MDPATLEALNRASSLELFHLSRVIERLMSDPSRIVQIRLHLNLGQRVRFVDGKAPGAALQLRSGTVVAMKDTQLTVQDDATRATWTLPYAAIELPADSRAEPRSPMPRSAQRPTREDFRVGDRVSFEDRHLQTRIGTIVDKLTTLISLLKPISPDAAACCRAMLPRTSLGRAKRLPLTVEQLCRVRELVAADVGRDDADDLMLLDLMTLTGARLGELMQLRASDVSKHDDMWHINIGGDAMLKTDNAYRTLPVSTCHNPELERWLISRALGGVGESPLFVDARPDAFGHLGAAESKRLNRIIRTLYVDRRIVLESVRNTVARTMRAEGVDPRVRRAMLGHADLDIHETHYDPEGLMTVEDFMPVVPVLEALAARVRGARPAAS
jgi:integrase